MKTAPLLPLPLPKEAALPRPVSRRTLADLAAAGVLGVYLGAGGGGRMARGGLLRLSIRIRQLFNKGGRS